jgi:hypothetical protein
LSLFTPSPRIWWAACALLLLPLQAAWAQSNHRCTGDNGRVYWSDKPCNTTKVTQYGPVTPPPQRDPYASSRYRTTTPEAPAHHQHLSGECRTLSEGLASARAKGLSYDTQRGLQREWETRCSADDMQARQKHYQERRDDWQAKAEAQRQAEANTAQQKAHLDQCAEMRRILRTKQARTDLTPGERTDLQRFEANYKSRCGG